jgi:GTP1/Obg family GTP-binding protein
MMNQMVQVMNNLSERLANLEVAQQQHRGMIVPGYPNQPQ